MTTMQLVSENKTQIEFSYDSGIPYKEEIRPEYGIGIWKRNSKIKIIKLNFNDKEIRYFKNKNDLKFTHIYFIKNEIWVDLEDCYVVLKRDKELENSINESNFAFSFFHNDSYLTAWGFSDD